VIGLPGRTARALGWAAGVFADARARRVGLDGFELGDADDLDDVRPVLEVVPPGPGPGLRVVAGRSDEALGEDPRHLARRRARLDHLGREVAKLAPAAPRGVPEDRERGVGLDAQPLD
jgi:hypothetical protein